MDRTPCTPQDETPQAMAFTVTFGTAKTTTNNKFIKRHSRNLSLPVVNVYEGKSVNGNGAQVNKIENHAEDYLSSETEEERSQTKVSSTKVTLMEGESSEDCSDAVSETGTYTIEKEAETQEVVTARLSIDTNFGIETTATKDDKAWINDWAAKAADQSRPSSHIHLAGKPKTNVSKIPSPTSFRARLGSRGKKVPPTTPLEKSRPNSPNIPPAQRDELNETERYLKSTERAMSALAAQMSLSIDSGGESEGESRRSRRSLQRLNSTASESGPRTRYNRAFSLRRGRLEDDTSNTAVRLETTLIRPMNRTDFTSKPSSVKSKPIQPVLPQQPQPTNSTRGDAARVSLQAKSVPKSPLLATPKRPELNKKKPTKPGGARSNSTLSSKEVEFQNWKRRKSYDPMKAAAEGKKKEAAKKARNPVMSQSSTNATTTPKSPVNSVLRSASFHTTRQLGGRHPSSSSEEDDEDEPAEDEEETTLSLEEWPKTQKTSLENTSGGSRGSLYSNNSGSPRQRPLEGVDSMVVSTISGISYRLNANTAVLIKKLRFLYDEESDKYKQLNSELEQLEGLSDQSPNLNKSTSRELGITLKNLRRLDSSIRVLNDVLFENVEYE